MRLVLLRLSPRHLVFDLDGTLVDTSADLVDATNFALRRLALREQPAETIIGLVGHGARALVSRAISVGLGVRETELDPGLVGTAIDVFLEYYEAHCLDRSAPYDGITELLDLLAAQDVHLSVLTNKPARLTGRVLEGTGLRARFGAVLAGDDRPTRKPDPAGLREVLAGADTSPEESILVGDSLIDLETARNGGVRSCAVAWGFENRGRLLAASPTWLVDRPAEIGRLLRP